MIFSETSLSRSYKNVPFVKIDSKLLSEYLDFCCNSLNKKDVIVAVGDSDDESSIRYHVNNMYIPEFIVSLDLQSSVMDSIGQLKKYIEGSLSKKASKIIFVNDEFDFELFKSFFSKHDSKLCSLLEKANNRCKSLSSAVKKLYDDIAQFNLDNGLDDRKRIDVSDYTYNYLCNFVGGKIVKTDEVYTEISHNMFVISNIDLVDVCVNTKKYINDYFGDRFSNYGQGVALSADRYGEFYILINYDIISFSSKNDEENWKIINSDVVKNWIESQHNYVKRDIYGSYYSNGLEVWSDDNLSYRFMFERAGVFLKSNVV